MYLKTESKHSICRKYHSSDLQ